MNTSQDEITLELLNAIEKNAHSSQRDLARHTGVALGLVNSYLKRCVKKGWIKITDAPANRYIYFVTPKGFSEKMRLTTRYISDSFSFYRRAASSSDLMLKRFSEEGIRKISLFGVSDLAEIVFLKSMENQVSIELIFDPTGDHHQFFSVPLLHQWPDLIDFDAVVLTDILQPDKSFNQAALLFDKDRIFVPEILGGWSGKEIYSSHNIV